MPTKKRDATHIREYDRGMLRKAFVSLFWSVISERRKDGYRLQMLADSLEIDKSSVSRWFKGRPNWTIDTISDIANALDLDLDIQARRRGCGVVYAPYGRVRDAVKFQDINMPDNTETHPDPRVSQESDVGTKSSNDSIYKITLG